VSDQSKLLALAAPPHDSLAFFGADPGWSPEREGVTASKRRRKGRGKDAPAVPAPVGVCRTCRAPSPVGPPDQPEVPADLLPEAETVDFVCATCQRSHYDGHAGTQHAPEPGRPSHRAHRIAGRPDPKLNVYTKST
jgi:hypothetical protein